MNKSNSPPFLGIGSEGENKESHKLAWWDRHQPSLLREN